MNRILFLLNKDNRILRCGYHQKCQAILSSVTRSICQTSGFFGEMIWNIFHTSGKLEPKEKIFFIPYKQWIEAAFAGTNPLLNNQFFHKTCPCGSGSCSNHLHRDSNIFPT